MTTKKNGLLPIYKFLKNNDLKKALHPFTQPTDPVNSGFQKQPISSSCSV